MPTQVSVNAGRQTVAVNGEVRVCKFEMPYGVAAVHWDGRKGYLLSIPSIDRDFIEWFEDAAVVAPFIKAWEGAIGAPASGPA